MTDTPGPDPGAEQLRDELKVRLEDDGLDPTTPSGVVDYRGLVEQIPAITYTEVHDPRSLTGQRTTFVSPQAARILGHAPSEFLADPELWRKLRHPADRAKVLAAERTAEITRQPFHVEYRMFTRDGRLLWFRDDAVVVEAQATGATVWQGVMFDITTEKRADEQARHSRRRYESLVETLPAIVYIDQLDDRATNVYTSPQSQGILGYSSQDWDDERDLWARILHPDDRARVLAAQMDHVKSGEPFDQTYRLTARDGHTVWVRDAAVIVYDEDGTPMYSQGFMLDVTSQKEVEGKLHEALVREQDQVERHRELDSVKDTLLHTLSHDLRAPLTAILATANTLLRRDFDLDDVEARELLTEMAVRAKRMDRLLTDLLDLERLGRGIVAPRRSQIDVAALVAGVVPSADGLEGREVTVESTPVLANVDGPKVERMVDNLLRNAAQHTPAGARLWVRVQPTDGGVLIVVEDEGLGVPDELKAAIFEPFRRGPEEEDGYHPHGTGIGLSLVARFAELHGGRAWVEDRPGGGASFRIFLPDAAPTAAA